ncbi:SRPBCC family protein [Nocardioides guangzhouensis]|uniref:SRPBCC family protein n=1 Tax=Nocardioides guangzhouensis TaxID=2497878 RepID=A0A4Q4Z729_9ACTN|nr:SRPBCC family protein [Nocardioides guangzhouensis]RYP83640.1 SRPBCC family protein [Nocardioides guangzhouensis]
MATTEKNTEAMDKLRGVSQDLLKALGEKALSTAGEKLTGATDKLQSVADGGPIGKAVAKGAEAKVKGDSPVMGGIKGMASGLKDKVTGGGQSSGGGKATKSTNIVETIDVGVPVSVAYNQWTEFGAFPSFMKKVENVEAPDDNKITFKAQIFLSHRSWEATILEQIPDERIVWRSKGQKGHVDGAVTFHEIGPNLTRILVVLEYYAQGLFEKTGNIWEAQGRRARAEIRHFRRHVMTRTILDPDEVEGWRGRIEDGEVVETHEEALEREEQEREEAEYDEYGDEEGAEEGAEDEPVDEDGEYDESAEDEPVDEEAEYAEEADEEPEEGDYEEEPVDEEAEYEEEPEEGDYEEEPADEEAEYEEEPEEEEEPRRRRRAS